MLIKNSKIVLLEKLFYYITDVCDLYSFCYYDTTLTVNIIVVSSILRYPIGEASKVTYKLETTRVVGELLTISHES